LPWILKEKLNLRGSVLAIRKGQRYRNMRHYLTFEEYDEHKRRLCEKDSNC